MNKLREYTAVCAVGSAGYSLIEILWRGFTHWSMALAGGAGFLLLYLTEGRMNGRLLLHRCAAGCAILTSYMILWFLLCVPVMPLANRIRSRIAPAPYSVDLMT